MLLPTLVLLAFAGLEAHTEGPSTEPRSVVTAIGAGQHRSLSGTTHSLSLRGRSAALLQGGQVGVNAGCFVVRDGHLLLVKHRKTGKWGLPAGTAEVNETPEETAVRETFEETGFRATVQEQLFSVDTFRAYRCTVQGDSEGVQDTTEIVQTAWKTAQELKQLEWRFPAEVAQYPAWMRSA
mmetsp:Transcript_17495/g.39636  ORF Transcript_17495/g.39636 Transcript_17495/m.39636 type:complete len:181 (+) Transcript_17495:54-596(+)